MGIGAVTTFGEPVKSAEMFRRAGDPLRAGKAYEAAADYERALACYREAGETERVIGVLERSGDSFAAAVLARENDDRGRAIKLLQQVLPGDANYAEACLCSPTRSRPRALRPRRAQARGAHRARPQGQSDPDLRGRLADLLERAGDTPRASVLEKCARRAHVPGHRTRIDACAARLAGARLEREPADRGDVPMSTEPRSRYEIASRSSAAAWAWCSARATAARPRVALAPAENLRDHPSAVQLFLREARAAAA